MNSVVKSRTIYFYLDYIQHFIRIDGIKIVHKHELVLHFTYKYALLNQEEKTNYDFFILWNFLI